MLLFMHDMQMYSIQGYEKDRGGILLEELSVLTTNLWKQLLIYSITVNPSIRLSTERLCVGKDLHLKSHVMNQIWFDTEIHRGDPR